MEKFELNKVVKFRHTRKSEIGNENAKQFDGTVMFSSLGTIISTFDGENQHSIIVSGDQSGRQEILTVYAPVDSPMKVKHVVSKWESTEESGRTRWNYKPVADVMRGFLETIPPEAEAIIRNDESFGWMTNHLGL